MLGALYRRLFAKGLATPHPNHPSVHLQLWNSFFSTSAMSQNYNVVFVLGRPGSGKGTQCTKITDNFDYVHLSAGDLLRAERSNEESEYGKMIDTHIKNGSIVPVEITCALLKKAMEKSGKSNFLIDGFPRNEDNLEGWNSTMNDVTDVKMVLYFNCSEQMCIDRCLERGKTSGRTDDNTESLKKRIRTYNDSTKYIIEHYQKLGLVKEVSAEKGPNDVFLAVKNIFTDL